MCWKKIVEWFKPDPFVPIIESRVALLFAIDDYPGSQNDLPDCVIDQNRVADFLYTNYPEFTVKKFKNDEVTRANFKNAILAQIAIMESGDILLIHYSGHGTNGYDSSEPDGFKEGLYLVDGTLWDDEFTEILQNIPQGAKVIIALDSCFAHGSTHPKDIRKKRRFVETQHIKEGARSTKAILKTDDMDYIVFAACQENQTSTSTGNGGVFTIYWTNIWQRDFTYLGWNNATAYAVQQTNEFDQIPNIEGNDALMNEQVLT